MKKYVLQVFDGEKNTAGDKAKKDVTNILLKDNFTVVDIRLKHSKLGKLLFTDYEIDKKIKAIDSGDVFVVQYPMYSRFATQKLLNKCRQRGIRTIGFVHDIESLRLFYDNSKKINDELSILNKFDCVISHNSVMEKWLKNNGILTNIVNLQIFDYLNKTPLVEVEKSMDVVFAGNLAKASFLSKWSNTKKVILYGVHASDEYPSNVLYKGVKDPDELTKYLSGSFGLVWDGSSMVTNDGIFGKYTMYNNPHKTSLYLSSGLPVIVWSKAAIADFVKKNDLGIVISDLSDLDGVLLKVSDSEYARIVANVNEMSKKLREGFFTKKAISKAINLIR